MSTIALGTGHSVATGASNEDADQMKALGRVQTLQPPITCSGATSSDGILPYTAEHDIGVLIYGPLAHGLLSGRMRPSTMFAADDWPKPSAAT